MIQPPHLKPYDDVLQTIGWTPLIRLNRVTDGARSPVYVKAESFNPGGSVKDRIGIALIEAAEREGLLGPGGTVVEGTSGNTGLKEMNQEIRVIAGDPQGSVLAEYFRTGETGDGDQYLVEGIGNDKVPGTLHFEWIDEVRTVDDRAAFHMARRITREEGLFVGGSTGLIVHVAAQVAREADDPHACIVAVLCDTGERYLSKVFNDEWLEEKGLGELVDAEVARAAEGAE